MATELKASLWVDDLSPPMTLEARLAIDAAERGDFIAAGGTIAGFDLRALLTTFQSVSDADGRMLRLDSLPSEASRRDPLREILFAVELKPTWLRHRYGFVECE